MRTPRAVTWILRTGLLIALIWTLAEPIDRLPTTVRADHLLATPVPSSGSRPALVGGDVRYFSETGYAVAPGAIADYFRARGGVRTFGPPVSNRFTLLGHEVQLFRRHALRQNPDGSVSTMSLLGTAIPSLLIGGRTLPTLDQQLIAGGPSPLSPDYAAESQAFIQANVPDQWEGVRVGFYSEFLATVTFQDAFPDGVGNADLLPGFAQEVWGLPVSRPTRDPNNPDLVYLRWERGVMQYDRRTGQVQAGHLGEVFKAVLAGEGLPGDLAVTAQGSPFYRQFDPMSFSGVARPVELPETTLQGAFVAAGQSAAPPALAAAPPTVAVPGVMPAGGPTAAATPTVAAPLATVAVPPPAPTYPPAAVSASAGPAAEQVVVQPIQTVAQPGTAGTPVATASPTPGPDNCLGDERITFSPDNPRIGEEMLIAVSSASQHQYIRLAGTEKTTFVRERPGQLGHVWEWTVTASYPGQHEYTFYVDSTIPCAEGRVRVNQPLATSTPTSTPAPTNTPMPTSTPVPTNTPAPTSTPAPTGNATVVTIVVTATPTATPATPMTPTPTPVVIVFDPTPYIGRGDRFDCTDFQAQAQAQAVLRADPSDPNKLDKNRNGIACEELPPPEDRTAVRRL